jgi:hypothetical protein
MTVERVVHKHSFSAEGDAGKQYVIDVFVDILNAGTSTDANAEIEGMKSLKTRRGQHVNVLGKGKYQIVQTGEILTSNDPGAV